MKKVTIQDVADYLKVSKSAVSHALSGRRRISPELSRRVQAAIDELGYKPDFAACVLNSRATRLIGVAIGELENPHTITLLSELSRELNKSDYSLTLCLCESPQPEDGVKLIGRISNGMTDAIINMLPQVSVEEAQLAANGTPIITYRRHKHSPITLDYEYGIAQALDYLTGLGHRRIGMISVSKVYYGEDPRMEAYCKYMSAKQLFDPALIVSGAGNTASGYAGAEYFASLPEPPSAILAANDVMAAAVLQWAHERELRLPEELSVIGSDNGSLARATYPPLTSIEMFVPQIAVHTARVLLSMIGNDGQDVSPIVIKPELVIRKSCCEYRKTIC